MKKLIIATAFILLAGTAFSQTLKKGNIIGVHHLTVTLKPDVTMDQYLDFTINTLFPEAEKAFPGVKAFIMQGGSGGATNDYATLFYFESGEVFSKYFDAEDNLTIEGTAAMEKLGPTIEKLDELGTDTREEFGWMIL